MTSTTVRLKTTTKEKLDKIGNFKESYDDIINRLIRKQGGKTK